MFDLDGLESFARKNHIPVMLSDTKELLYKTVKELRPERILEIGTAVGYSGLVMLGAYEKAKLNTVELNEDSAKTALENFEKAKVRDRINLFLGDAKSIVPQLTGKYDFIFLDGPKGQYVTFFPYLADLLNVGGVLFADNVLYKGLVEHIPENKRHKHITVARNMRSFLDEVMSDSRFQTTLHRIGDGVTISVKTSEKA